MPEVGLTRVATVAEKLPKAEQAGLGRVGTDIAGPTTANDVKGWVGRGHDVDIAGPTRGSSGDVRIDNRRADKGKNALRRNKVCSTDKEAVGREEAGGRPEEVSVGLVRRRETPRRKSLEDQRRTDIWGISRTVVGRTLGVGPAEGLGGGTRKCGLVITLE
ncbi:hypothetical protein BY996DRAFT_6545407 [Phakopsora pachyrhizi]|nr:hypothetical protein BY996DRAFT_6545407 [Phakopsora pachyrhizi]